MSLEPGSKPGPYGIVGAIGAGGMVEGYRARDPRVGREERSKCLRRASSGLSAMGDYAVSDNGKKTALASLWQESTGRMQATGS